MSVSANELIQYHLEQDLGLPKLTLRRWLKERLSHREDAAEWQVQQHLLDRRTRCYTVTEIRLLLKLGDSPYRGFEGIDPAVRDRLKDFIDDRRAEIVSRTEKLLKKHERSQGRRAA